VTNFLKTLSIKTKLTLVIMLTSTILLIVIGTIVLVVETFTVYSGQLQELRVLSRAISANSGRELVLGKYADIDDQLKTLVHQKNIHAAYFFDETGRPVAEYQKQNSPLIIDTLRDDFTADNEFFWSRSTEEQLLFYWDHFSLFTPVFFEGRRIGTFYLMSDLNSLYGHLSGVAFGMTLSLLLLIFLSWILADYLQKPVSTPVLQLAQLMTSISKSNDYSIRAEKLNHDEVGVLVDGFNRMLEQIELQQASLAEHQIYLEETVVSRTAELRTAIAELEKAKLRADAANEAKSQFLSRMTHELRTPLIGVLGMNELLSRTALSEQQKSLVDTVQKSGEQLLGLISDVLDFSRIEAGKLNLDLSEFRIHRVIDGVITLMTPQAEKKGITLNLNMSKETDLTVLGDEIRIRQILINLVANAIKFTNSGSVAVGFDCLTSPDSVENMRSFLLEVQDTGAGMTEEVKSEVFGAFYQAEGVSPQVKGGTGLGLAIVKQLVDLMHGRVELTSMPGKGSCFRIYFELPLANADCQVGRGTS
jgi:signal transduction histidine kinase